jgi:hypothetical protein
MHEGRFIIRLTMGQFDMKREDLTVCLDAIRELAAKV